jgi:hypothetical protein
LFVPTFKYKDNKMIKELIEIANELDKRGLSKEADMVDKMIKDSQHMTAEQRAMSRTGGVVGYGNQVPSVGQRLFQQCMQAYWDAILDPWMRNFYGGDDEECVQKVINAAQYHFDTQPYSPTLPEDIIRAGMYVECGPRTWVGDTWFGQNSLFRACLEGGDMRTGYPFSSGGTAVSARFWQLFKDENDRRYEQRVKEEQAEALKKRVADRVEEESDQDAKALNTKPAKEPAKQPAKEPAKEPAKIPVSGPPDEEDTGGYPIYNDPPSE